MIKKITIDGKMLLTDTYKCEKNFWIYKVLYFWI